MAVVDQLAAGYDLPPIPTRRELEAAGIRIAIGIPMERQISDLAFLHLWQTARQGWPLLNLTANPPIGYGRTDVNRERLARAFLATDYTHLMMFDTDHLHPPESVNRLARWFMTRPQTEVVFGLQFRRGEPYDPMMFQLLPDGLHAPAEWEPGLFRVHAAAHGTMLIRRDVLERLPEPWWRYEYATPENETWPSEDLWFCKQCREHGIELAVDTTQTSPHMTTGLIDAATFIAFRDDHPERFKPIDELIPHEVVTR